MHKPISELSSSKDSISYSIGADIGDNLVGQGVDIDYDAFLTGLKTGYEKKEHMLTMQDRKALFKSVQNQIRQQQQIAAKNSLAKAEIFLSKNKSENLWCNRN
jgi:FKBP-type peptidyl-prolyl cis-trans isomerases 1